MNLDKLGIVVVAFMQSAWFKKPTKHLTKKYRHDQEFHRRLLARSMSGRRLIKALGPELFSQIHWDNASTQVSRTHEQAGVKPDAAHVLKVISEKRPDLILTFGSVAADGVKLALGKAHPYFFILNCHHPNARHKTQAELNKFGEQARGEIKKIIESRITVTFTYKNQPTTHTTT